MKNIFLLALISLTIFGCSSNAKPIFEDKMIDTTKYTVATFGAGCFWCTEAVFTRLKGVAKVESGYSGGNVPNPTYEAVCTGKTGHAECTNIYFDPAVISYTQLLEVFFKTHNPTTLNQQGADVGTQYRSVIFYHNNEQKQLAEKAKIDLTEAKIWDKPIVTEISEFRKFYVAEDYHQDYYENNTNQGYCAFVITPKIEKFEKVFKNLLK
ncbi:MAG: peptide-methionine (S)-S-oxide reductase MsrA [Ignavibacteriales bacterium]|nr:peptide-methionine (S)-S-oxide reductase MsrA [Ignavibacteriales bacterium]